MLKLEHKIIVKRVKWSSDNHPQGEIKFNSTMCQGLVIVAKDGWNYKEYDCRGGQPNRPYADSRGMQVRISMNGPLKLTMEEWKRLNAYIDRVYQEVLDEHVIRGI